MKVLLAIIATLVVIAALVPHRDQRFDIVVSGRDGWAAEDVRRPHAAYGVLIGGETIPHRYVLTRDAYTLEVLVNPANHGFPVILQIRETTRQDGSALFLEGSWPGPCAWLGKVADRAHWQSFFTDPDALGFFWAPAIYCSAPVSQDKAVAREASTQPIRLRVVSNTDRVVLGEEVISFEIKENGSVLYYLLP